MTTPLPTVLIADDHPLMLDAIAQLLATRYEVVGRVGDGAALVDAAQQLEPDAVVSDVSMPHMGGIEAARRLRSVTPRTRVVFMTVNEDPRMAAEAFRLGALGWVLKSATALELTDALAAALRGERYLSSRVVGGDLARLPIAPRGAGRVDDLTDREREVLTLLARGHSMKDAATRLGITPRTIAFHKYRMQDTLGLGSTAELVKFASDHGLV